MISMPDRFTPPEFHNAVSINKERKDGANPGFRA